MKRPSYQHYPADWRNNAKLRRCSWEARGVWIEVLGLMHDSDEYGILRWDLKEISQALGAPIKALKELVLKEVMKGADRGEIEAYIYTPISGRKAGPSVTLIPETAGPLWYSPRMVRDEYVRTVRGQNSRFGDPSNDSPKGGLGESFGVAPKAEPTQNKSDGSTSSSSSSSSNNKKDLSSGDADDHEQPDDKQPKPKADRIPYDEIFDLYNEIVAGPFNRPAVKIRNDSRKRAIKKIWNLGTQTKTLPWWEDLFVRATHNQRWMNGGPGKDGTFWEGANFDFLLREDNFVKIVE